MERPIRLKTHEVQAIVRGDKTQICIPIKPQPPEQKQNHIPEWGYTVFTPKNHISCRYYFNDYDLGEKFYKLPYQVGDILWVRETFGYDLLAAFNKKVYYKADEESEAVKAAGGWHPSIHMPRSAARLFLKVIDVRVERLQDITEEDALLEGLKNGWEPRMNGGYITAMSNFKDLWDSIYGKSDIKKWESDPWVWITEFEVTKNEN